MNKFRIDDSFRITSVGFVFVGEVVQGSAKAGMRFEVPEAGHRWQLVVKAVEFILLKGVKEKIGLVVRDADYLPGLGVGWTAELRQPQPNNEDPILGPTSDAGSAGTHVTNKAEIFARTGEAYLCLIRPVMEDNAYRREIAPVIALSSSVPDELLSNMIVGTSWRERLLGLCMAMAKNPITFVEAMVKSLHDVRGISIVPACAALAVLGRRGLFDITAPFAKTIDRSAFDGEVGWAIDKAMYFAGIQPETANGRGPNYGQVFENHTDMYEWILDRHQDP